MKIKRNKWLTDSKDSVKWTTSKRMSHYKQPQRNKIMKKFDYTEKFMFAHNNVTREVIMVNGTDALHFLSLSTGNRIINEKDVLQYARIMESGDWEVNGEPIIFDENGNLIEGHHRLHGVVKYGYPVPMLFIRGVSKKAKDTLNQGQKRSIGQVMDMLGITDMGTGTAISAITKGIKAYKELGFITDHLGYRYLPRDCEASINEYGIDSIKASFEASKNFRKRYSALTPASAGILHYILSEIDSEKATRFLKALETGDCYGDPELLFFREHLKNLRVEKRESGGRLTNRHLCGICIKAWNAMQLGRKMQKFEYKTSEGFPQAI